MYALTIPRAISANAQTLNPAQIKQIDDIAKASQSWSTQV